MTNHINRNTTLRQDKMLIKSVTLTECPRSQQVLNWQMIVSQIVSIFAIISETLSSPPTRIKWIYYPCTYRVARIWWPWYFARSQGVLNCLHKTWWSAWTYGWIMLGLSKIWLENAQIKLTRPSPHFSVTRDIKMLKFLCTACLHHIRTRQKKSSTWHYLNMSREWYMYDWVGRKIQSCLCLNHIVLYGVKDNTWIWTYLYWILYNYFYPKQWFKPLWKKKKKKKRTK